MALELSQRAGRVWVDVQWHVTTAWSSVTHRFGAVGIMDPINWVTIHRPIS